MTSNANARLTANNNESRPAYFTVQLIMGRETPAIYWDELPRTPIPGLIYVTRLDELPNAPALLQASLTQLFQVYQHLKLRGKLPPRWEPPKRKVAPEAIRAP